MKVTETAAQAITEPVSTEIADLRRTIDESKIAIAEKSDEVESKKRKGGRPAGSRDKKPRKRLDGSPIIENSAPEKGEPAIVPQDPLAGYTPSPFIGAISYAIQVPFQNYAAKTGCEKIKLDDAEATAAATEFDKALFVWMPDLMNMDPKVAVLLSAGAAIGGLALSRTMIYDAWKAEQAAKQGEAPPMKATAPGESAFPMQPPQVEREDLGRPKLAPNGINGFENGFATFAP